MTITDVPSAADLYTDRAVVAAIVQRPDLLESAPWLRPEMVDERGLPLILGAVLSLRDSGATSTPTAIVAELQRRGELDRAGGHIAVSDLVGDLSAAVASFGSDAELIRRRWAGRQLLALSRQAAQQVQGGTDPADVERWIREGLDRMDADHGVRRNGRGLQRVDLAALAGEGTRPLPVRLCEGRLYGGCLHSLAGEPDTGKTTVMYDWVREVLATGGSAVVLDEESGEDLVVERLLDLGTTIEQLRSLAYFPFPGLSWSDAHVADLRRVVDEVRPAIIGLDSSSAFMAAAGLDEDRTAQASSFYKRALLGVARYSGAATVIVDHDAKDSGGSRYSRGSGSKLGLVDVAYKIRALRPFSRDSGGLLKAHVGKDRRGYLHRDHEIRVETDGGRLRLVWTASESAPGAQPANDLQPAARKLLEALGTSNEPMTSAAAVDAVHDRHGHGLRRETVSRQLGELRERGLVDEIDQGPGRPKLWFSTVGAGV